MKGRNEIDIHEDKWILTQCGRCFSNCAIRVRRINGVAVRIEGNPDSWMGSQGGVCGKGVAGLQVQYDPNRLNVPLRRTNPDKGLYVDPMWKEISWDEALNEIAEKLKKVIDDDPRKILLQSATMRAPTASLGWRRFVGDVLGTPNRTVGGGGLHCGNGAHFSCGLMHGSWDLPPYFKHCNYAIYWGVNNGHATGHSAMVSARLVSEAMEKGMKLVVFDPMCNYSSAKATEWIPIIPGTDGAVALAMCNVILNELGICDSDYIKKKTNGAYLVDSQGHFLRDPETNKPLIWDPNASEEKVFDDESISDYSLEGIYEVKGVECRPAFEVVKEDLKKYSVEMASKESSVPEKIIRRIATEYAEAAQIGSTINIEGYQLPLRPVSSVTFRGGEGHQNAFHTCMAVSLLNHILGAADVPGGTVGLPNTCHGYPGTGKITFGVEKGPDGMLTLGRWFTADKPWPVRDPAFPDDAGLQELFTMCSFSPIWGTIDQEEIWQKIGLPFRIELMLNFGCNSVMGVANPETQAEFLKKIPFIVSWDLFANEFAEGFADILLPDTSYLETLTWMDGQGFFFNYPYGMDPWCYHITQPVVKPAEGRRYIMDVCFELLDRIGKRAEANNYWNNFLGLNASEKFEPTRKLSWEELTDKSLRHLFGPEHDLEWFEEHGCIIWPKKVEEAYWRCFTDARVPIYMEFMLDMKTKVKKIADEVNIKVNWEQYTPFVSWFPCEPHLVDDPQYDLYCFSYRDILHTGSATMEQPWLDEASNMNPYTYNVTMNTEKAREKNLKDGDVIQIESSHGHKVQGVLKVRKGQHPQTMGIAATAGHWAKGQPIARNKGSNFNRLMEARFEQCDPITFNIETCVKVKVTKGGKK